MKRGLMIKQNVKLVNRGILSKNETHHNPTPHMGSFSVNAHLFYYVSPEY